jgi:hypothetical protein
MSVETYSMVAPLLLAGFGCVATALFLWLTPRPRRRTGREAAAE